VPSKKPFARKPPDLAGNLRGSEIAAVFIKALPRICKILASRSGPFVARITKAGEVAGV
jgi:hypothetical protein